MKVRMYWREMACGHVILAPRNWQRQMCRKCGDWQTIVKTLSERDA